MTELSETAKNFNWLIDDFVNSTAGVTDAIAVAVGKGLRVNLVEDCVVQPGGGGSLHMNSFRGRVEVFYV